AARTRSNDRVRIWRRDTAREATRRSTPPAPLHPGVVPRRPRYPRSVTEPSVAEVIPRRFSEVEPRIARIDDDARAVDGHPALADAVWLDLKHPSTDSAGFLVDDRAYAHISPSDNTAPSDDATPSDNATLRHWTLGVAVS